MEAIIKNALISALNGEHTAVKKYSKFAEIAQKENYPNIAYLFKSLVYAENIHITNHLNALKEVFTPKVEPYDMGETEANINHGYLGEMYEYKEMYPNLRKTIRKNSKSKEGKVADLSLRWAQEVELTHAQVLKKALKTIKKGKDLEVITIYVCRVCGNLRLDESKNVCPVCGHDTKFYQKIERGSVI